MDAAIANYPEQRFTLRDGILVIRQHPRTLRCAVLMQLGYLRIKRRRNGPPPFASGGGLVVFRRWRLRLRTSGTHRTAVTWRTIAETPIGWSE
jgi:hypothetical protein